MTGKLTTMWPRGLRSLQSDVEEMFGNLWKEPAEALFSGKLVPAIDVAEEENVFEVRMDAPGMQAKDFDIDVHGNIVTIRGERKQESEEKGKTWHRVERRSGTFSRSVMLSCNVNEDEVVAEYADGVLKITLPKTDGERPRKVAVKG